MRRFVGVGGSLYALGERLTFASQQLLDCGDGWDWRAPDEMSYWVEDPIITVVRNGESMQTGTVESFLATGRVGLPCNMSHGSVWASGVCLPISWVGDGTKWLIDVEAVVSEVTSLGDDVAMNKTVIGRSTGVLYGAVVPIQKVLARFPLGAGVFTGIGTVSQIGSDSHIDFREGVTYVTR